jgi:hypothetical protein
MSKLAQMQAAIAEMSETANDMTEVQKGGGAARLLPEGYAYGRMIECIELGNQPQQFEGKAKDPKAEMQIAFALWGEARDAAGNSIGTYHNEDGTPYVLRPYSFAIDRNDKARAYLLFKSMNWKGQHKNFGQMLGEAFLVKIVHVPKSKKDPTIVSRIDLTGFLPPVDPVQRMPYPIPDAPEDMYKWFFWDKPTVETWNSLFIEGNLDDGRSKNFVQEKIAGATNFAGSPLEAMLLKSGLTKPVAAAKPAAAPATPAASPVLPAASAVAAEAPLAQTPASSPVVSAPVVSPVIPGLGFTGLPASPAMQQTTSPSSPVLPQ